MSINHLIDEAKRLSHEDQSQLLEALAEMVGPVGDGLALTPRQRADLERRIEELDSGKANVLPGDEVFAQLRKRG